MTNLVYLADLDLVLVDRVLLTPARPIARSKVVLYDNGSSALIALGDALSDEVLAEVRLEPALLVWASQRHDQPLIVIERAATLDRRPFLKLRQCTTTEGVLRSHKLTSSFVLGEAAAILLRTPGALTRPTIAYAFLDGYARMHGLPFDGVDVILPDYAGLHVVNAMPSST